MFALQFSRISPKVNHNAVVYAHNVSAVRYSTAQQAVNAGYSTALHFAMLDGLNSAAVLTKLSAVYLHESPSWSIQDYNIGLELARLDVIQVATYPATYPASYAP